MKTEVDTIKLYLEMIKDPQATVDTKWGFEIKMIDNGGEIRIVLQKEYAIFLEANYGRVEVPLVIDKDEFDEIVSLIDERYIANDNCCTVKINELWIIYPYSCSGYMEIRDESNHSTLMTYDTARELQKRWDEFNLSVSK